MKKAFSLIELSIVILIIGILLAGVTSVNKILYDSKLKSAKALTLSSPVSSINNLSAWYEATTEESFPTGLDPDSSTANKVTYWYDINPQSQTKNNAYQSSSSNQPIYIKNAINGLPAVNFTYSSSQYLNLPDGTVPYANSPYTIFFVVKASDIGSYGLLGSGDYGTSNATNAFRYELGGSLVNYWWSADITTSSNVVSKDTAYVLGFYYDKSIRKIYVNGSLSASLASSYNNSTSANNTIGKAWNSEYFNGNIAEIIIFYRALKDSERKDIESYLGKKWAISLT